MGRSPAARSVRRRLERSGVTTGTGDVSGVGGDRLIEPPLGQGMWIESDTKYFGLDFPKCHEYLGKKICPRDNFYE